MQIQANESLQARNSLALCASSQAFANVRNDDELVEALDWGRNKGLSVTPWGEGSNIVLAGDLPTLVLQQARQAVDILEDDGERVLLRVTAAQNWHRFVDWSLSQGFFGLENLAFIPGTVGAAPIQNIGAYGVEVEDFVEAVHGFDIRSSEPVTLTAKECEFGYRDSVLKHQMRDRIVITTVDIRLSRSAPLQLKYPALAAVLAEKSEQSLTQRDVFDAVVSIRQQRLPDPATIPNAGSFFKNPVLDAQQAEAMLARFPGIPSYLQSGGAVKFPAAWMIDHCGWKGHRENGVGVHPEHALVLVNYDSNSGVVLLDLADKIAASVKTTFAIDLEIEPRVYGRDRG